MTSNRAALSVVIPVFRAEATLEELHRRLTAYLPSLVADHEIVFVEDGGGDRSWEIIARLAAGDPRVRGIRMSRNYGQHNALLAGIRAARHALIVTMDDDLQHPVEGIGLMLAALGPGTDVVYGAPIEEQHGLLRNMASRLTKMALAGAMGAETARSAGAFRLFRARLREGFAGYRSPFVSIDVLLTWTTSSFAAVRVRHAPRAAGVSGYTLPKLVRHAVNLMTGFSTLPLQIASVVGFAFLAFGAAVMAVVLINFAVRGGAVPGFATIASLIVIFSGAQLFALGVIGEYLARMHFRTMDRPAYVVAEEAAASAVGAAPGGARQTGRAADPCAPG